MRNWLAGIVAQQALVVVVALLAATSVAATLSSYRATRPSLAAASPSPVAPSSPTPTLSPSPSPSPVSVSQTTVYLSAPSTSVVWAFVDYAHLYRSVDRGGHWEQRSLPASIGGRPVVSFVDDHEGWLVDPGSPSAQCEASPAAVWHTSDAGATWQQLKATGIGADQCKSYIWFADSKRGFLAGWDATHPATIYRTSDGGSTWSATKLVPDPPNYQSPQGGAGYQVSWIKLFGSTFYLGALGTPYVYRSTDGGASWKWFTKVGSPGVVMVTESRWLDLNSPGFSYESVNGGQGFGQFASDFNTDAKNATQFVFPDAQVGYASGAGLLQRTVDGGVHWTRLSTPGSATPPAASPSPIPMPSSATLSAPSTNVVWALVAGQYLFGSTDQGKTWTQHTAPPHPGGGGDPLISFVDGTNGWDLQPGVPATQCEQQGVQLWRTTDGANTWQLVSVAQYGQVSPHGFGLEQCKEAIYFADTTHGFVGAADPSGEVVYRTVDGGLTWSATQLPNPPGFQPGGGRLDVTLIKSFGSNVMLYAPPYVFDSTDAGVTWQFIATGPQTPIAQLNFLTPTHWLKIQSGLETTDAGASWHAFAYQDQEAAGVPSNFVFFDDRVGYATARGDVRRTVDGGAHFLLVKGTWP